MGAWVELRREECQGRGQTMNTAMHWESVKHSGNSEVCGRGTQSGVQGENGGSGWKGSLDKKTEVLTCQTKECGEPLVISHQGK